MFGLGGFLGAWGLDMVLGCAKRSFPQRMTAKNRLRKGNSRFPAGMEERKASATANADPFGMKSKYGDEKQTWGMKANTGDEKQMWG
jgi:hypothetical protein